MPAPNPIKYTAGATADGTIKKGNFVLGVSDIGVYANSVPPIFWNGITPSSNTGYTVYQSYSSQSSNSPSIRCANNDTELIDIANDYGCTGSTIVDSLTWFATGSNYMVINFSDYPALVTNGLVTLIDAGSTVSYPRGNNTIYDAVNNVNNGTLVNGTIFSATGGTGGSLSFDGIDDYVAIGTVPTLTSFSVDVWFYTPTLYTGQAYSLIGSFANQLQAYVNGGGFVASFALSYYQYSAGGYNLGAWNNVVFTYSPSTQDAIFYINGVYDSTTPSVTGISYNGDKFLGVTYPGDSRIMKGNISVVKVYSRAITAGEVSQNYNAYKVRYI